MTVPIDDCAMSDRRNLNRTARQVARLLASRRQKIVFAESCTGGLVSATLTEIPGISEWLCGSAVVYQVATKAAWLGVDEKKLKRPGPVSRVVAEQMAAGVLRETPAATISAAVTGHLGPGAPARQDGLVYVAVQLRSAAAAGPSPRCQVVRRVLEAGEIGVTTGHEAEKPVRPLVLRRRRQVAAACLVLQTAARMLESLTVPDDIA